MKKNRNRFNTYYRFIWEDEFPDEKAPVDIEDFIVLFGTKLYTIVCYTARLRSVYVQPDMVHIGLGTLLFQSEAVMKRYERILQQLDEDKEEAKLPEEHKAFIGECIKGVSKERFEITRFIHRRWRQVYKMSRFTRETCEHRFQSLIRTALLLGRARVPTN